MESAKKNTLTQNMLYKLNNLYKLYWHWYNIIIEREKKHAHEIKYT